MTLASPPAGPIRRVAYLGTPDLAVAPLRALVEAGVDVALVVSQPDRRRGRGSGLVPSPVRAAAVELGIPVAEDAAAVVDADVPLAVVVAYGRIIKRPVLEAVPMVNLHFSPLPRWRGAAPVERAILAGDARTAVDLMAVEEGLDTGGVYERAEVPFGPDDPLIELRARLVAEGSRLLVEALAAGLGDPAPQVGEPTYAEKLTPEDRHLDWSGPAIDVHRRVRLGDAWTTHDGKRLKVWRTHVPPVGDGPTVPTADGPVELVEVQPEGRARMAATAWANGVRWHSGQRLGP